jgi:hypothetical protein
VAARRWAGLESLQRANPTKRVERLMLRKYWQRAHYENNKREYLFSI